MDSRWGEGAFGWKAANVQRSPSENLFYLNRVWKQSLRNSIQNKKCPFWFVHVEVTEIMRGLFKGERDSERNPWRLKVNHWTWKQNIHFSRSPWNSNGTLGTRKEFWKRMRSVWLEILLCIWRDSTQFERAFFKYMEGSLWTWMELSRKLFKRWTWFSKGHTLRSNGNLSLWIWMRKFRFSRSP